MSKIIELQTDHPSSPAIENGKLTAGLETSIYEIVEKDCNLLSEKHRAARRRTGRNRPEYDIGQCCYFVQE